MRENENKKETEEERDDLGVVFFKGAGDIPTAREVTVRDSIKSKILFVFFLILTGVMFSFALSFFSQALAFNNKTTTKTKDGKWDIAFTDVKLTEKKGRAVEVSEPYFEDTKASFNVSLNEPGDEIVYTFRIANRGNLNAMLNNIIISPENKENDDILYYVEDITKNDYLDASTSKKMKVVVKYNEKSPGNKLSSKNVEIILNYVQR